MDHYRTVFVITEKGFDWWFSAAGLGFVVLGLILIKVGKLRRWEGSQRWVGYFMVGFATLWTLIVFSTTFSAYYEARKAYRTGQYSVVEGTIENFRPMPYSGHQSECFSVGGQEFCYSDYVVTAGFNNTASHGGQFELDYLFGLRTAARIFCESMSGTTAFQRRRRDEPQRKKLKGSGKILSSEIPNWTR